VGTMHLRVCTGLYILVCCMCVFVCGVCLSVCVCVCV